MSDSLSSSRPSFAIPNGSFPRSLAAKVLSLEVAVTVAFAAITAGFYWWFIEAQTFTYSGHKVYTLFDDAMISMRYARNLADGHGLTWNVGQTPVEGYTNPLWTVWMACLHLIGISEASISLYVSLSSAVLLVGAALVVWRIARHLYPDDAIVGRLALFGTALYYPLVFWSLRGMEVGLVTFLLSVGVLCALRLRRGFSIFDLAGLAISIVLGILTRMEFVVPALVVAAFAVAWTRGNRIAVALLLAGVTIVTLVDLTAFRFLYYGQLLPNTYYLKVSGVPLEDRLWRGIVGLAQVSLTHLSIALALVVAFIAVRRRQIRAEEALLLTTFLSLGAYSTWVGGDAWDYYGFSNRYLTPAVPLLLVVAIHAANDLLGTRIAALKRVAWLPAVLMLVSLNFGPVNRMLQHGTLHSSGDAAWSAYGLLLRDSTAPDATLAVTWAGAAPYFSHRTTFDELGKTDSVIAKGPNVSQQFRPGHSKWDFHHTIGELHPDVVTGLYFVTKDDLDYIQSAGYEPFIGTCFYQLGSPRVDIDKLTSGLQQIRAQSRFKGLLCTPEAQGSYRPDTQQTGTPMQPSAPTP